LAIKSPIACSVKQSKELKLNTCNQFDIKVFLDGWGKLNEYLDKYPHNLIVEGDDIISVDPKTRFVEGKGTPGLGVISVRLKNDPKQKVYTTKI